jgi:drug/metabolite transporter (DMT)-like permease
MNFVLAICASLFWGTSDFLGGLKTRTVPLVTVLMLSQVAGLAGIAIILLIRGQPFPADDRILFAVAAAPVNLIALGCIYYATALGPMIVVAPVAALGAAFPLIIGLTRGNSIGLIGALGVVFALAGVTVAGWKSGDRGKGSRRYVAPTAALVSALATGVFFIFLNEASRPDPYWAVAVTRASSCALVLGYFAIRRPVGASPRRLNPVAIATIAAVGLTDMGAEVSFAAASQTGQLSVISVLASLYPVVTVLLAIIVLRDRATWIQLAGAVVTIFGAVLLAAASP